MVYFFFARIVKDLTEKTISEALEEVKRSFKITAY